MHTAPRPSRLGATSALVLLAAATCPALGQWNKYVIDDLGTLTGRSAVATAAVDAGLIAGYSAISGNHSGEPWYDHACLFAGGEVIDLGVLGPDVPPDVFPKPYSRATGVNAWSEVVGTSVMYEPYVSGHGFLWLPTPRHGLPAGMNALPECPDGEETPLAINDDGWIAGMCDRMGAMPRGPLLWRYADGGWTVTELAGVDEYGVATAINDKGQVTGWVHNPGAPISAFIWLPQPDYGLPTGLHYLSQDYTFATAINYSGQIVGRFVDNTPFLWLPEPAFGWPAGLHELDLSAVPNAVAAWPTAIDDGGIIVGRLKMSYTDPQGQPVTEYHPFRWFRWAGPRLELLDDLIWPLDHGWSELEPLAIGDDGTVVGSGIPAGSVDQHAFRLRPVTLCDLNCDGTVNFMDINPFVMALVDPEQYATYYPDCVILNGDFNGDGQVSFRDINLFVGTCGPDL